MSYVIKAKKELIQARVLVSTKQRWRRIYHEWGMRQKGDDSHDRFVSFLLDNSESQLATSRPDATRRAQGFETV